MTSINNIGELVVEIATIDTPGFTTIIFGIVEGTTETLTDDIWLYYGDEYTESKLR